MMKLLLITLIVGISVNVFGQRNTNPYYSCEECYDAYFTEAYLGAGILSVRANNFPYLSYWGFIDKNKSQYRVEATAGLAYRKEATHYTLNLKTYLRVGQDPYNDPFLFGFHAYGNYNKGDDKNALTLGVGITTLGITYLSFLEGWDYGGDEFSLSERSFYGFRAQFIGERLGFAFEATRRGNESREFATEINWVIGRDFLLRFESSTYEPLYQKLVIQSFVERKNQIEVNPRSRRLSLSLHITLNTD